MNLPGFQKGYSCDLHIFFYNPTCSLWNAPLRSNIEFTTTTTTHYYTTNASTAPACQTTIQPKRSWVQIQSFIHVTLSYRSVVWFCISTSMCKTSLRKSNETESLLYRCKIIGNSRQRLVRFLVQPGDRIYMYSDGLTERKNKNAVFFSKDQILNCLHQNRHCVLSDLIKTLVNKNDSFAEEKKADDDLTLLGLEFHS